VSASAENDSYAGNDRLQDHFHRWHDKQVKIAPDNLPESLFSLASLQGSLEQWATELLDLVYQKCQHHQVVKHR